MLVLKLCCNSFGRVLKTNHFKYSGNNWIFNKKYAKILLPSHRTYAQSTPDQIAILKSEFSQYQGGSITLEKSSNGVAHMVINHPEKKNAISGSMMVDFANILDDLETWKEGVAVILRANENQDVFCSGADKGTLHQLKEKESGLKMAQFMHSNTTRLQRLPMLTVTLLDGKALGGGAELTTATDFRIVTDRALVMFVHGRMGLAPGWGGATRLVNLVGYRKALDLLITGRKVKACCNGPNDEDGVAIGYFDAVLPGLDPIEECSAWVSARCEHTHRDVLRVMKQMCVAARDCEVGEAMEKEQRLFWPLWGGEPNRLALEKNIKHK